MELDIGELNKRIEIIDLDFVEDEIGQDVREEMQSKKVWAKVEQNESKETVKNLKNEAQEEKEFTIRYRKGIKKTMKIRYKEKNYDISSIKNVDERDQFLILRATTIEEETDVDQSIKNFYREL